MLKIIYSTSLYENACIALHGEIEIGNYKIIVFMPHLKLPCEKSYRLYIQVTTKGKLQSKHALTSAVVFKIIKIIYIIWYECHKKTGIYTWSTIYWFVLKLTNNGLRQIILWQQNNHFIALSDLYYSFIPFLAVIDSPESSLLLKGL